VAETLKQQIEAIRGQLKNERAIWEPALKEIDRNILPDRCQWSEMEQGRPSTTGFSYLLDDTPVRAIRTCQAGLHSGITNPARPWFELDTADQNIRGGAVAAWLEDCRDRMLAAFATSNLYNVLPLTYGNCAAFGFDAVVVEDDDDEVFRFESLAIGTYYLSTNAKRRVDCIVREFRMTVRQIVEKFGEKNISEMLRVAWADSARREEPVAVVHVVCPNRDYNARGISSRDKRYSSVYYEASTATTEDRFLSRKGFDSFPVLCPRWETTGRNAYGQGPGKQILGHAKALQAYKRAIDKGTAKKADPPLLAPSGLQGKAVTQIPGGITYYDETAAGAPKVTSLYDVNAFDTVSVFALVQDARQQIREATFADLFLMISNSDRRQVTAEEIRAKQEEKILQVGPVLENLNDELLDPLIDRCFNSMLARGLFAEPPPEIQGQKLRVRYVSTLAQVQKMLGLGALDRLLGVIGNIAGIKPDIVDNFDADKVALEYHDMLGVTNRIMRPEPEVQAMRQQRAQAQAQAQATEAGVQQAQAAKLLSETDTRGGNALTDLLSTQRGNAA
jgi:hypothetical protein